MDGNYSMGEDLPGSGSQANEEVYLGILNMIKSFSETSSRDDLIKSLNGIVDNVVETLAGAGVGAMLNSSRALDEEDYFVAHSLNVCLIAVKMGIKLGYKKRRLKDLALLALSHAEEYIGIPEDLLAWVEHDKEIDDIVKLADVYDSLTHPPSYRHELTSADTLMSIIDSHGLFDPAITKMLLNEVSLYPMGSFVELNTGEVGEVVSVNKNKPMRPVVRTIKGPARTLDLAAEGMLRIVRSITEEEMKGVKRAPDRN